MQHWDFGVLGAGKPTAQSVLTVYGGAYLRSDMRLRRMSGSTQESDVGYCTLPLVLLGESKGVVGGINIGVSEELGSMGEKKLKAWDYNVYSGVPVVRRADWKTRSSLYQSSGYLLARLN